MQRIEDANARAERALGRFYSTESVMLCVGYQVGDTQKAVYRRAFLISQRRDTAGYNAEAQLGIADAVKQLRLL
ncbi:hypothetical protein LCGC14_2415760, partial [marine sediment metagenome]